MIFKERDSSEELFRGLEEAITKAASIEERKRFERELAIRRAGVKGEQEAAYHIDFHLKESTNWAVVHDLRIECKGRVAQIDHLIISRFLEVYVIESKSFRTKIRHANGGWERINFNHWKGIPSPVEQNERHIVVLKDLLEQHQLAPSRFGLKPTCRNVVVVQPSCSIVGDIPADARIYRMDNLVKQIRNEEPSAFDVLKIVSQETLYALARSLAACHSPGPKPRLPGVTGELTMAPSPSAMPVAAKCQNCCRGLSDAETRFCRLNATSLGGQLLCQKCQGYLPRVVAKPVLPTVIPVKPVGEPKPEIAARCASCGTGVEHKVVAFCRFNSKRFGGRVLCRPCQGSSSRTDCPC